MLNRTVRNLAVAAVTTLSAAVLIPLGATSASASTLPKCGADGPDIPRICVQVFGNGNYIAQMNGWMWNTTGIEQFNGEYRIELYLKRTAKAEPPGGSAFHFIRYCTVGDVPNGHNSANCSFGPRNNADTGYYCAALLGPHIGSPSPSALEDWVCAHVD